MDGMRFTVLIHLHGALAANASGAFALPCGATLVEASGCASNASNAQLQLGTAADDDGIMALKNLGQNGQPLIFDRNAFDGALALGQAPHLARSAVLKWLIDFDGAGGTAGQNVEVLLTFLEG